MLRSADLPRPLKSLNIAFCTPQSEPQQKPWLKLGGKWQSKGWETSVGVFKMVLAIVIHVLYPHCIYELFQNICRFAPVLLLPRYIVATRSISLRSQNGCTVLWNAHVNTKIASFWKFSVGWTVTSVVISYLGTSSAPSSSEKLLPSDIASSVAHSGVGT